MNGAGKDFFAGPRFAGEQYRKVGFGGLQSGPLPLEEGLAAAHNMIKAELIFPVIVVFLSIKFQFRIFAHHAFGRVEGLKTKLYLRHACHYPVFVVCDTGAADQQEIVVRLLAFTGQKFVERQFLAVSLFHNVQHFGVGNGFCNGISHNFLSGFSQVIAILLIDIGNDSIRIHHDETVVRHPQDLLKDIAVTRGILCRHIKILLGKEDDGKGSPDPGGSELPFLYTRKDQRSSSLAITFFWISDVPS